MALSRKHYEAIAEAVRDTVQEHQQYAPAGDSAYTAALEDVAVNLAAVFARDNERFDTHRFLDACGVR